MPRAHWVPRVAPAGFLPLDTMAGVFGPIRNNFGTRATAYLGEHRVGLLAGGHRALFARGSVVAVAEPESTNLDAVLPIAKGLGGGFLFAGPSGLFFAERFDGRLHQLSSDRRAFLGLAPHAALLSGVGFVSLPEGSSLANAPQDVERVFQHRAGMAIATSATNPNRAWLTTDGQTWKALAISGVRSSAEDGDALLLFTDSGTLRVAPDAHVTPLKLSEDQTLASSAAGMLSNIPERWGLEEAYEGALIDAGWTLTGRGDDEWMGVRDDQLFLARASRHELLPLGSKLGRPDENCGTALLTGQPLLVCLVLGSRLSTFRIDLAKGTTLLERVIEVKHGVARHLGSWPDTFPSTLVAFASCDGDAATGFCIRRAGGEWSTFPTPRGQALSLFFPGELVGTAFEATGGLEIESSGGQRRTFSAREVKELSDAMGGALTATPTFAIVTTGALRTAAGLRMFYGSNPTRPITNPESYALDLPFNPQTRPAVLPVEGVIAPAGMHALRLAKGRIWQSDDAWQTWHEIEPPPTGVPRDLAGAMCVDSGCLVGGWARIGW